MFFSFWLLFLFSKEKVTLAPVKSAEMCFCFQQRTCYRKDFYVAIVKLRPQFTGSQKQYAFIYVHFNLTEPIVLIRERHRRYNYL